jgi:ABC-2 type transport system permease protein
MSTDQTARAAHPAGGGAAPLPLPSLLTLGLGRIGVELKGFFRNREAVVFSFSLQPLILLLFGAIFSGQIEGTGIDFRQYFVAGVTATGILTVSFTSLAIGIAIEQDDGTLKRLAGTPMPEAAYFVGKLGMVLVVAVLQTVLLLAIGVVAFGLDLPGTPARWLTLAWVFVLGATACSLTGIAYSRLPRNARSASAVVTPPYLVLQFISGVFFVFTQLPEWLQTVAAVFPLKWMAQGLRSVFLPASFAASEPAGSWELDRVALVLAAWCVAGFLLSMLLFRWRSRRDG